MVPFFSVENSIKCESYYSAQNVNISGKDFVFPLCFSIFSGHDYFKHSFLWSVQEPRRNKTHGHAYLFLSYIYLMLFSEDQSSQTEDLQEFCFYQMSRQLDPVAELESLKTHVDHSGNPSFSTLGQRHQCKSLQEMIRFRNIHIVCDLLI